MKPTFKPVFDEEVELLNKVEAAYQAVIVGPQPQDENEVPDGARLEVDTRPGSSHWLASADMRQLKKFHKEHPKNVDAAFMYKLRQLLHNGPEDYDALHDKLDQLIRETAAATNRDLDENRVTAALQKAVGVRFAMRQVEAVVARRTQAAASNQGGVLAAGAAAASSAGAHARPGGGAGGGAGAQPDDVAPHAHNTRQAGRARHGARVTAVNDDAQAARGIAAAAADDDDLVDIDNLRMGAGQELALVGVLGDLRHTLGNRAVRRRVDYHRSVSRGAPQAAPRVAADVAAAAAAATPARRAVAAASASASSNVRGGPWH